VNLYPSEIEHVILDIDGVAPHYRIDLHKENNMDVMELTIECEEDLNKSKKKLNEQITKRLSNVLQFTPDKIDLVDHGGIGRSEVGKVQRVYDHRE
jgi:phenylacetate-CoA ligase